MEYDIYAILLLLFVDDFPMRLFVFLLSCSVSALSHPDPDVQPVPKRNLLR